jgi:phosphoribosyl 1,2-cyclic phosphodiesterase
MRLSSNLEYAVGLAEAAGARTLVLFHHDPSRTDDEIDALVVAHAGGTVEVVGGAEGLTIDL